MNRTSVLISAAAVVALCSAAQAGPSEAMAFAIGQCSSQPDDKARLLCYDMLAAQLRSGTFVSATAPQPFVQLPQAAPTAQAPVPPVAQQSAPSPAPMAQLPTYAPSAPAAVPAPPAPRGDSSAWYDPTSWFGKDVPQTSNNPADFGAEAIRNKAPAPDQPKQLDEMRANVAKAEFAPNGKFIVTLENGQVWRQLDADTGTARFKKGANAVTISRGMLGSYNLVIEGRAMLFKVKRLK